ncbi:MAG: zf-HC2 domain-containing protein [Planctomycetes bacterium]|nr:zf-HC2 domain-containing protein [Planctomycetota bacterium]
MTTPACEWTEERLPLLAYGELDANERDRALAHLEACDGCRAARAALEGAAAALAAVPLRHPDPARLQGLKARVLAAVGADPCPREADLLDPDAAGPDLAAHVEGCAPCREAAAAFAQAGQALTSKPLRPFDAASARATPPAPTLASRLATAPAARRASSSSGALAAAAAVLVATGAFALGRATAPRDHLERALTLKTSADQLVRGQHPQQRGWVAPAITAYERVIEAVGPGAEAARRADRELAALQALERLQGRGEAPSADELAQLMVDFPDAPSTFACVFQGYTGRTAAPLTDVTSPPPGGLVGGWRGSSGTIPYAELEGYNEALKRVTEPRLRQALRLQRALQLEEAGKLQEARECYEQVLAEAHDDTPAARLARVRLGLLDRV